MTKRQQARLLALAGRGVGLRDACDALDLDFAGVRRFLDSEEGFRLAVRLEFAAQRAELLELARGLASLGVVPALKRVRMTAGM